MLDADETLDELILRLCYGTHEPMLNQSRLFSTAVVSKLLVTIGQLDPIFEKTRARSGGSLMGIGGCLMGVGGSMVGGDHQ